MKQIARLASSHLISRGTYTVSNLVPFSPIEQEARLRAITEEVLPTLPIGWTRFIIRAKVIGRHVERETGVKLPDGSVVGWLFDPEVWRMFMELRSGMYFPDVGTWVEFKFMMEPPGRFSIKYNRDQAPQFETYPSREDFALDKERYSRSDANMPDWYRRGLNGEAPQD
ncbi:hypothetical protein ACFVUS_27290 [Nocardia sp. NPDC058058]|uniref:hypothetical protein n=1 Tax=Nocardia sp. NPDC058058 TaxID=3346317 RepID=UPI0036D98922